MLLSIFVSDMDSGTECTFRKFVDDTELCGAVDRLREGMPSRGTSTDLKGGPVRTS